MLTPESLAELRRLYEVAFAVAAPENDWEEWTSKAAEAFPALLDAAEERDALAARLEGAEAVIEVQDVHARLVIAERDEAMRALGKLTAERDAEPDRIAELTAERDALAADRDALRAMLAGRCLSDITHRDEEHRQSVCMLPVGHAPLAHDDCMGCTWTDADHWEPSAIDALAEECDGWRHLADVRAAQIARVRALPIGPPSGGYYMVSMRDVSDALDADNLDPEPACLIHDVSGEDVSGWEMAECTCPAIRALGGEADR